MCKGLIGEKLGMTGIFSYDGRYIPITVLQVGPCVVTQIKKLNSDGYEALQLGFKIKKKSRTNKPLMGHFKKSGDDSFYFLKEFKAADISDFELGQIIGSEIFKVGEKVDVSGITKGRGFSGVMKRYGFSGGRKTHGSRSHRVPGSIGCSAWPGKVIKGKKMPGQYGVEKKTIRNLEIVDIKYDENIILVKGSIPGYNTNKVVVNKIKFAK